MELCDCILSHNGCGYSDRICDCEEQRIEIILADLERQIYDAFLVPKEYLGNPLDTKPETTQGGLLKFGKGFGVMSEQRLMPQQVDLGQSLSFQMGHCIYYFEKKKFCDNGIMGFRIPSWQRPLVWTRDQEIKFIESAWLGLPLGTYTYNQGEYESPLDGILIDGQQRMMAIQRYLQDEFSVFGYKWSQVTKIDQRIFENRSFHAYVTKTEEESYLKNYYNLMNFGGTAHKEGERV